MLQSGDDDSVIAPSGPIFCFVFLRGEVGFPTLLGWLRLERL
jgi:hypothetical protein